MDLPIAWRSFIQLPHHHPDEMKMANSLKDLMQKDAYLNKMLSFVQKAGDISLGMIAQSGPSLKPDASVITKADKAISQLAKIELAGFLAHPDHLLLDEEDPRMPQYLNQGLLDKKPYVWALDPIDGTRLYANRMPLFGVSIGLLKDLKPWLGVVYFPMLKELFYCDGDNAYFVQNAFSEQETRIKIVPINEELSARSLFFCNDTFFDKFYWQDKDFHIMIHACAVVNLCWPAVGRGVGCFLRCHPWDFAGSWPIIKKAGIDFRRVSDGKVMEKLSADDYGLLPKPWHMKEYYLISSAQHYPHILSKIGKRT